METTTVQYRLRAKRELTGAYDIITYRKGSLFYPWHRGEGDALLSQEFIDEAYKKGYVENNCGHGCTESYRFPDDWIIEKVTTTTITTVSTI